jgi:hypothetical protein
MIEFRASRRKDVAGADGEPDNLNKELLPIDDVSTDCRGLGWEHAPGNHWADGTKPFLKFILIGVRLRSLSICHLVENCHACEAGQSSTSSM